MSGQGQNSGSKQDGLAKHALCRLPLTVALTQEALEYLCASSFVEWGALPEKTDEELIADYAQSLKTTRAYFDLAGPTKLHGVYAEGTETVMAHIGNSPTAGVRAVIFAQLWNALRDEALKMKAEAKS
jgi:hypothetical protein